MSAIDSLQFPEIVLRDGVLVGEYQHDPLEPISADDWYPVSATRIERTGDPERPFVYAEDVELACEFKVALAPGENGEREETRGEWAFVVRAEWEAVDGLALVMALHPFSEDWLDWAPFLRGTNKSHEERMRAYDKLRTPAGYWKDNARRDTKSRIETNAEFSRAVLCGPTRAAPQHELGRMSFQREELEEDEDEEEKYGDGKRSDKNRKMPRRHWGLCPVSKGGIDAVVAEIRQTKDMQNLLRLASTGWLELRYHGRNLKNAKPGGFQFYEQTKEAADALLDAAILKALAGPKDVKHGPRKKPWTGQPVQWWATSILIGSLNRQNRRAHTAATSGKSRSGSQNATVFDGESQIAIAEAPDHESIDISEFFAVKKAEGMSSLLCQEDAHSVNVGLMIADMVTEDPHWHEVGAVLQQAWRDDLHYLEANGPAARASEARRLLDRVGRG